MNQQQKGFTLVELLVVVGLLGIVVAMSTGLFISANYHLSASQEVLDQMTNLRSTLSNFRQDVQTSQGTLSHFQSELGSQSKLILKKPDQRTVVYAFEPNKNKQWTLQKKIYQAGKVILKQVLLTQMTQGFFTVNNRQVVLELTTYDHQKFSFVVGLR